MAIREEWEADVRPYRQRWNDQTQQCRQTEYNFWGLASKGYADRDINTYGGCGPESWVSPRNRSGSGNTVVLLQQAINAAVKHVAGLCRAGVPIFPDPPAALNTDGVFGPRSEAALKYAQRGLGLQNDGICGPGTWAKLKTFV